MKIVIVTFHAFLLGKISITFHYNIVDTFKLGISENSPIPKISSFFNCFN